MTKNTCSVIGLIVAIVAALAFLCVPVIKTDWLGGIRILDGWGKPSDSAVFACFAYGASVALMIISCICVYTDNVKATNVLFSIASILPVIATLVLMLDFIDTNHTETYIGTLAVFSFIQIAVLICYHNVKNPEKVEKPKDVGGNIDITKADPKDYAAIVARSPMYNLRVYAYDKKGTYDPLLSALAFEEVKEREAGRRRRLTGEEI